MKIFVWNGLDNLREPFNLRGRVTNLKNRLTETLEGVNDFGFVSIGSVDVRKAVKAGDVVLCPREYAEERFSSSEIDSNLQIMELSCLKAGAAFLGNLRAVKDYIDAVSIEKKHRSEGDKSSFRFNGGTVIFVGRLKEDPEELDFDPKKTTNYPAAHGDWVGNRIQDNGIGNLRVPTKDEIMERIRELFTLETND